MDAKKKKPAQKPSKKAAKKVVKKAAKKAISKTPAKKELTAEQFVKISLDLLPKIIESIVPKMETFAETIDTESGLDPFEWMDKIQDVMQEVYDELKWRFEELGTEWRDFKHWEEKHKEELDEFLAKQPDMQKKLEALKTELTRIVSPDSLKEHKARKKNNPTPVKGLTLEKAMDAQLKLFSKAFELVKVKLLAMSPPIDPEKKHHIIGNLLDELLGNAGDTSGNSWGSREIQAEMQALGTSFKEFITWTDVHGDEMKAYMQAHPEYEQKMVTLRKILEELEK